MFAPWLDTRKDPKGFAAYNPRAAWRHGVVDDVLVLFAELEAADALPMVRALGGLRTQPANEPVGSNYTKIVDNPTLSTVTNGLVQGGRGAIKRLRQAGRCPGVRLDGSSISHPVSNDSSAEEFVKRVLDPDAYEHDLRVGQPVVVELHSESAELTTLLRRVAAPYGVRVSRDVDPVVRPRR